MRAIFFAFTLFFAGSIGAAHADEPDVFFRLDTGGHTAILRGLTFTPDGKHIVSVADDKVARIWDWKTGRTVRTIRGQSAPTSMGGLYAVAVSRDGRWLALGGYTRGKDGAMATRLYDFESGELVRLLEGHRGGVNALAFSPDGRRLVSSGGVDDNTAIIWDVASGRRVQQLKGHTDIIFALAVTPDSKRLVTGSDDTTLRMWDMESGRQLALMTGHKFDIERALDISPDGKLIASGDMGGEIRLWDGETGAFLRTLAKQNGRVGILRFSRDGTRLVSACAQNCRQDYRARVWDVASGKELLQYEGHDNVVASASISPDGKLVATGGGNDHSIQVWELDTGKAVTGPTGKPLRLAGNGNSVWATGVAKDGSAIAWGQTPDHDAAKPELNRGRLETQMRLPRGGEALGEPVALPAEGKAAEASWQRAVGVVKELSLANRVGGKFDRKKFLDILRADIPIATIERGQSDGEAHRAYSFTPDGRSFVSAGSWGFMQAFEVAPVLAAAKTENAGVGKVLGTDITKKLARQFLGHEGDVWAVTPSPDGRLLVTGASDQTVRLWNLGTGELIVSMLHGRDGEWVMWTPQGFYTGSAKGGAMIGWHINHGVDKAAEYVTAKQVGGKLDRRDIIERSITMLSAKAAVAKLAPDFDLGALLARASRKTKQD